MPPSHLIGVRL
ncbi:hypothetical protein S40293_11594 [Stachybotrys chartarum IBT 40293]|nr:hypothetical protein S40293_11594 [Stachybotrys chartarum IBT 40293]